MVFSGLVMGTSFENGNVGYSFLDFNGLVMGAFGK